MRTACVWLLLASPVVASWCSLAQAEPTPLVRLRGTARIEAHAGTNAAGEMVLRGTVTDDVGEPLREAPLSVSIVEAEAPESAIDAHPRPCGPHYDLGPFASDARGAFCGRLLLPIGRYVAHLVFAGNGLVYGASTELDVDLGRHAVVVQWVDPPASVDLSLDQLAVEVLARTDDGEADPDRHRDDGSAGMPVVITDERGTALARGITDRGGRARLTADVKQAGAPGPGRWVATYEGSIERARASASVVVNKHLAVSFSVPTATGERLPPGVPEDGINIRFVVSTARGAVDGGSVEARAGGVVVGAAPVRAGVAELTFSFATDGLTLESREHPEEPGLVPLTFCYLASTPWYDAPAEQTFDLPVRAPSRWRELPLLLAGGLALAWFAWVRARGRLPAPAAVAALSATPKPIGPLEATLTSAPPEGGASEGWVGKVIDARSSAPIEGAVVVIERGTFEGVTRLARGSTDARGRFVLPPVPRLPGGGESLAIEAPLHVSLRRPLPAMGLVNATLVSRRDALLGRFVNWARRRGGPFDARPEPTPHQVRLTAGADAPLANWALAVESAVYAGMPVDAGLEAAVDARAPQGPFTREGSPLQPPPDTGSDDADVRDTANDPAIVAAQAKGL